MNFKVFKIKAIPTLFWSSKKTLTLRPSPISFSFLILGLLLFGLGEALLIAAGVGVSPWTVFAQGISINTDWSIGVSTAVISSLVLFLWIFLKQTPGLGTIFNVIIISIVLDLSLPYLPNFETLFFNILMAATGVLITGFGGLSVLLNISKRNDETVNLLEEIRDQLKRSSGGNGPVTLNKDLGNLPLVV